MKTHCISKCISQGDILSWFYACCKQISLTVLILFSLVALPLSTSAQYVILDILEPVVDEDCNLQVCAFLTGLDLPAELVDPECGLVNSVGFNIFARDQMGNTPFAFFFSTGVVNATMNGNDVVWEINEAPMPGPVQFINEAALWLQNNTPIFPIPIPFEFSTAHASDLNYPVPPNTPGIIKITVTLPIDATPELEALFATKPILDFDVQGSIPNDFYNPYADLECPVLTAIYQQGTGVVATPSEVYEESLYDPILTPGLDLTNNWQYCCDDYSLSTVCTTCGCGDPIGQVWLYNDGNLVDPATTSIEWLVNGATDPQTGNPFSIHYMDPILVTAIIDYTSLTCNETLSVELVCEGDCPTVQFATCDDPIIQQNYGELCLTSGNICIGEESLVFLLDRAGNLIDTEKFMINWYDDGVNDTNPFPVQIGVDQNCVPIDVRVYQLEGCNEVHFYEPDCCSQNAPTVECGNAPGGIGGNNIWWPGECGTDFYEVEVICTNGFYYDLATVSQPGLSGFYEFNLPSFGTSCTSFNIHVRGFCTERQAYGPWSDCVLYDQLTGCTVLAEGGCEGGIGWLIGNPNSPGLTSQASSGKGMNLFPNPLQGDLFSVRLGTNFWSQSERLELRVMDVNGKIVGSEVVESNTLTHSISLSGQPDGIYLIGVYSENGELLETSRLVKGRLGK